MIVSNKSSGRQAFPLATTALSGWLTLCALELYQAIRGPMTGSYDYRLVTLSVVMAVGAAYAALDLAGRTTASRGRGRLLWLAGDAAGLGLGICSMHSLGRMALL